MENSKEFDYKKEYEELRKEFEINNKILNELTERYQNLSYDTIVEYLSEFGILNNEGCKFLKEIDLFDNSNNGTSFAQKYGLVKKVEYRRNTVYGVKLFEDYEVTPKGHIYTRLKIKEIYNR